MKFLQSRLMLNNSEKSNTIRQKISAELDWWIEVYTANPSCIYYFGAFYSLTIAALDQYGYIQDLRNEGAKILSVAIKQYQPQQLTICQTEFPQITSELKDRKIA